MPIKIVRNDISKMEVDAIVNPTDDFFSGSGGVDAAIHKAAGPKLKKECMSLESCKAGEAKITAAYKLKSKYVIHTVGPVWQGGNNHEDELLSSCYKNALELARRYNCESIAMPLISAGTFNCPQAKVLKIAMDVLSSFLMEYDMLIYIVLFSKEGFDIGSKLFSDIKEYIDDNYVDKYKEEERRQIRDRLSGFLLRESERACRLPEIELASATFANERELEDIISQIDESFSQMLLRKIDEKGMKDSECYKRANIDRKLFSKIRSDINYRPSKVTAIAFGIALELPLDEFNELLQKAGYALSHSNKFDVIVEYFIKKSKYNIFEINEALFAFDQVLLGV